MTKSSARAGQHVAETPHVEQASDSGQALPVSETVNPRLEKEPSGSNKTNVESQVDGVMAIANDDSEHADNMGTVIAESEIFALVQAMHNTQARWLPGLRNGSKLNQQALREMMLLRKAVIASSPQSPFDAALIAASAKASASFGFTVAYGEKRLDKAQIGFLTESLQEAWQGLNALQAYLEAHAGITMAELGLFSDDVVRQ